MLVVILFQNKEDVLSKIILILVLLYLLCLEIIAEQDNVSSNIISSQIGCLSKIMLILVLLLSSKHLFCLEIIAEQDNLSGNIISKQRGCFV